MKQTQRTPFFTKGIFVLLIILSPLLSQQNGIVISGKVVDAESNHSLFGVNVFSGEIGTSTDRDGFFTLSISSGDSITVSMIGYKSVTVFSDKKFVTIRLVATVLRGEEVIVYANRAIAGVTPVAFSTLTASEIDQYYVVEDVPMVLANEPGVYAYSESGNGTGYSYVSIRGFDQSRISVMIDNVPLNDNESHQVYWVDHGDILSNARDVQIQRGIGNSLYGSASFGGSINVMTEIAKNEKEFSLTTTSGSYNTTKSRIKFNTGHMLGDNISLTARASQIQSDGYRKFHESLQRGAFLGFEHRSAKMTNQVRATIGYENSDLLWDGIAAEDINNRKKRRSGYESYTDDFLQQIYSLNSMYQLSNESYLHNVAYFVTGSGYYEVFKTGSDFYSYNLDMDNQYSDGEEMEMETDLLRRKWIQNKYYGLVPRWMWNRDKIRFDMGGELRFYTGDHFGEVTNFSDPGLAKKFGNNWYKYYQYIGTKRSISAFAHLIYSFPNRLKLIGDVQFQGHQWKMDQKKIGHAKGYQLNAPWNFLNPRIGFIYSLTESFSFFGNYGKAQKEPSDDQIINADDVWSEPEMASAEVVNNYEIGGNFQSNQLTGNVNIYRINYANEQLKNIDVEQEGEYAYYSADTTIHQGVEFEIGFLYNPNLRLGLNGTLSQNFFNSGENDGNTLPNVPGQLFNMSIQYLPINHLILYSDFHYVGRQYIDENNTKEGIINSFSLINVGMKYSYNPFVIQIKINNLLDTLYSTYGYGYEWDGYWAYYWPGATRNYYVSLTLNL